MPGAVIDACASQVLEKEFDVALTELSKAEMDVKEKRLTVTTYRPLP